MDSAYALSPRIKNPSINPGDKIEIEIFITGHGAVKRNKLFVSYSSPNLINAKNPGVIECCIKVEKSRETGEIIGPLAGKQFTDRHKCDPVGTVIGLTEGYFLDIPHESFSGNTIPIIMPERMWDGMAPVSLALNTLKKAPPGDYDIYFVLSYSDGKEVQIDQKRVPVHVKSAVERHWRKATIIALLLTGAGIVLTLLNYLKVFERIIF